MAALIFFLIAFSVCLFLYVCYELINKYYNHLYRHWKHNKGICRHCKSKWVYLTKHGKYSIYTCDCGDINYINTKGRS